MDAPVEVRLESDAASRRPLLERKPAEVAATELSAFMRYCAGRCARQFEDYAAFEHYAIECSAESCVREQVAATCGHGGGRLAPASDPA